MDDAKPKRGWRHKFAEAFNGLVIGSRGQSSFSVHFFFAILVVVCAAVLECNWIEWCLLIGCIGLVFTAELLNSALETLFHALDDATKNRMTGCLDIAAGAVLVASTASVIVGCIVFGQKLIHIWK
ncbi:diacylglycerol kinase [soil metagenome]